MNAIEIGTEKQPSPREPVVVEPEPPMQRNEIKLELNIGNVVEENIKLKASLDEAVEQLKTLRDEAQTDCSPPSMSAKAKSEEFLDDVV